MTLTPCERRIRRGNWKEDALLHRCAAPIGPRNTWSNVAYALAGFAIYAAAPMVATGLLMAACVFLAFGSGLYHAYKTPYYNAWDHNGIYLVFGALAVFGWTTNVFLMAGVGFLLAWVNYLWRDRSRLDTQVGVLLALTLAPIFWYQGLAAGAGILAVYGLAYGVQRLDHAHSPLVDKWGHAFWHILSALAIFLTALVLLLRHLDRIIT